MANLSSNWVISKIKTTSYLEIHQSSKIYFVVVQLNQRYFFAPTGGSSIKIIFEHLMGSFQDINCLFNGLSFMLVFFELSFNCFYFLHQTVSQVEKFSAHFFSGKLWGKFPLGIFYIWFWWRNWRWWKLLLELDGWNTKRWSRFVLVEIFFWFTTSSQSFNGFLFEVKRTLLISSFL